MVQCMKCALFMKYETCDMRDIRAMYVICTMKCMKCAMK